MSVRIYNAAEVKQDLYDRIPSDGEFELLLGNTSLGDSTVTIWQYQSGSSSADNFINGIIQPTLQTGNGRWIRQNNLFPTLATVATSGAYADLSGKPTASYLDYSAILTQTGTSAPTVNQKQNDFGATTFSWTRSGAGTYILTASTAVFTIGKTVLINSTPPSPLINYSYIVNSTTQITFTTGQLAVLLTILGATASDGLLTNTLCEVRVYS